MFCAHTDGSLFGVRRVLLGPCGGDKAEVAMVFGLKLVFGVENRIATASI